MRVCISTDRSENDGRYPEVGPLLFAPSGGKLIYQPSENVCLPCVAVLREYQFAFAIRPVPASDYWDGYGAASAIGGYFLEAAKEVLAKYSDTSPVGWQDESTALCRAHRQKASQVLGALYFEDVEYCLRLIAVDETSQKSKDVAATPTLFRIQSEVTVAVTKNPGSPFREPTSDEMVPYGELLVKMVELSKQSATRLLQTNGWLTAEQGNGVVILTGMKR
jgi:hypothetical protein